MLLTGVVLLFLSSFIQDSSSTNEAKVCSVYSDDGGKTLKVEMGMKSPYVAFATFEDSVQKNGWSTLHVATNGSYKDSLQAQAAGMAEGYITSDFINMHYQNTLAEYCTNEKDYCTKLSKFMSDNSAWMQSKIKAATESEKSYWHQVDLVLTQLKGIQDGYALTKSPKIDAMGFTLMQTFGDLEDLEVTLGKRVLRKVRGSGHCSALVKLLPKNLDLMISQVTWNDFNAMLRVFKLYSFDFHKQETQDGKTSPFIPARNMSFSSYPGLLFSGDDFHILSSGMVTQETTIGNSNADLWKYVSSSSLLEWLRTIVANRLADSAPKWAYIFEKYNSGTYNNQWMILDYNKFSPGKPLQPDTFWVLEQIPGAVQMADMTMKLVDQTYWPSFNIPYFPYIYNLSGVSATKAKLGSWFDYDLNPRSQIFKRGHAKVQDIDSLFKLMRYNDFKNDALSKCNCTPPYSAENAISARSDLNPADGKYPFAALGHRRHGGTDCKATNYKLMQQLSAYIVAGPTHDTQPVFQWSKSGWKQPLGHPDAFNFEPFLLSWK